jgi:hypothetical protein
VAVAEVAAEQEPGAAVRGPGAAAQEPGAAAQEPGAAVQEPGAAVQGPVAAAQGPVAAARELDQEPAAQGLGQEPAAPGAAVRELGQDQVQRAGAQELGPDREPELDQDQEPVRERELGRERDLAREPDLAPEPDRVLEQALGPEWREVARLPHQDLRVDLPEAGQPLPSWWSLHPQSFPQPNLTIQKFRRQQSDHSATCSWWW